MQSKNYFFIKWDFGYLRNNAMKKNSLTCNSISFKYFPTYYINN